MTSTYFFNWGGEKVLARKQNIVMWSFLSPLVSSQPTFVSSVTLSSDRRPRKRLRVANSCGCGYHDPLPPQTPHHGGSHFPLWSALPARMASLARQRWLRHREGSGMDVSWGALRARVHRPTFSEPAEPVLFSSTSTKASPAVEAASNRVRAETEAASPSSRPRRGIPAGSGGGQRGCWFSR